MADSIDDALERAGAAAAPAVDPVADRLRARVRAALFGTPVEPTKIDRFAILEPLGRGGMGTVFAAYDPVLDRKVALKLIRAADDAGRDRVLREARALAKVVHPNVVAVHDVGSVDDVVYIAMELISGGTLRAWAEERRASYAQIVAAYIEVGRGLAAAHAAGVVHGDVKPDNLVIGSDGRARVIDFGLARSADDDTDARGGTPAYMAPEQLAGAAATTASDQFSFCAALHEALYGERPFSGSTVTELRDATATGTPNKPPSSARVPAWLRRVILRGLTADPAARYASMDELVRALAAERRRRFARVGFAVAVLGLGAAFGVLFEVVQRHDTSCDATARLGEAWSGARQAAIGATLGRVHVAPGELLHRLGDYAAGWRTGFTATCKATHIERAQSAMLDDLRVHCLDQRRLELDAVTAQLASTSIDAAGVARAISSAWQLPELAACADTEALARGLPLPQQADVRARIDQLTADIARVRGELDVGRYRDAAPHADALRPAIDAIEYAPTRELGLDLVADAHNQIGDFAGEEPIRRAQLRAASEARDSHAVAGAWLALARCVAQNPARLAIATEQIDAAENESLKLPANGAFTAQIETFRGDRAHDAGDDKRALELLERALDHAIEARGADHPDVAVVLSQIARISDSLGNEKAGLAADQRALAIREKAYGPDHPDTARSLTNVGIELAGIGERVRARELLLRAIAIHERAGGHDDFNLAYTLKGLGDTYLHGGKPAEAIAPFERAVALWEAHDGGAPSRELGVLRLSLGTALRATHQVARAQTVLEQALVEIRATYGEDNRVTFAALDALGNLAAERGDFAAAKGYEEQAIATLERKSPNHPDLAALLLNLAETTVSMGHYPQAVPLYRRSIAINERALGADSSDVGFGLGALGHAAEANQDHAVAREAFTRALPILAKAGAADNPELLGIVQFGLAQELWASDRVRASELAIAAKASFTAAAAEGADDLKALDQWATTHPLSHQSRGAGSP